MSIFAGTGQRGGNRGGKDLFQWDDVRGDKYKEYYLGQTTRLQTNWWLKGKLAVGKSTPLNPSGFSMANPSNRPKKPSLMENPETAVEIEAIKRKEQLMMMQEMGMIPKQAIRDTKKLEKHEFKELCRRGNIERAENDPDKIGGIGYIPANSTGGDEILRASNDDAPATLEEELIPDDLNQRVLSISKSDGDGKRRDKKSKKEKKERKKEKKEKKKEKKEKKHKMDRKRERSDSDRESSHRETSHRESSHRETSHRETSHRETSTRESDSRRENTHHDKHKDREPKRDSHYEENDHYRHRDNERETKRRRHDSD